MERIAIVTGAGSGVGRATTLALAEAGFAVALAGRRQEALEETAAQAPAGARLLVVQTDVTDEASVARLFDATIAKFGRLDVLFNNAGAGAPQIPLDEFSLEQWNSVVAVNLTGSFLCARAAFRQMKRQSPRGGRIINNGSISAHVPRLNSAPYTATKHAITGLTKSLSLDGRAHDIVCGQIDIGNAATPMATQMSTGTLQANGAIATEPTIDVRLVAEAVVHMASLPLNANIPFLTIMAAKMPYAGRG